MGTATNFVLQWERRPPSSASGMVVQWQKHLLLNQNQESTGVRQQQFN